MTLTIEEVEYIAGLARLQISEIEKIRYREQLSAILDYASRLNKIETGDTSPDLNGSPGMQLLRSDIPEPGLELEELLSNASDTENQQFRVPPILE